jgi:hypothetical protein
MRVIVSVSVIVRMCVRMRVPGRLRAVQMRVPGFVFVRGIMVVRRMGDDMQQRPSHQRLEELTGALGQGREQRRLRVLHRSRGRSLKPNSRREESRLGRACVHHIRPVDRDGLRDRPDQSADHFIGLPGEMNLDAAKN